MNTKTPTAASPWRTVLLIVIVATADVTLSLVSFGMGLESGLIPADPDAASYLRFAVAPILAPLGAVALIWRRRFPKSVAAAAALLGALSFSGLAFFVALFLLAKKRLDWWVAAVIALAIGAEAVVGIEPLGWEAALAGVVLLAAIAAWGAYRGQRVRLRDSHLNSLKDRVERAEAERAAETERSKLAERHRIAREMHDTLAHRMSLVAVQAASLQVDSPDAETAAAAKLIRETAHAALGELRDVLGVLHEDGTAVTQPWHSVTEDLAGGAVSTGRNRSAPSGIEHIDGLLQEWRQAGVDVEYIPNPQLTGARPDAVSRAAFRIVQEGITNVARHADQAQARVSIELHRTVQEGAELLITVSNGPGATGESVVGAGRGLVGLAERVRLLGGTLEHGPVESGYQLRAAIPVDFAGDRREDRGISA